MSRLPSIGGDDGVWGEVLNEYLLTSHNADGTLRPSAVVGAGVEPAGLSADTHAQLRTAISEGATNALMPGSQVNPLTGWFHAAEFGAVAGSADSARGINAAILAASAAGGGTVFVQGHHTVLSPIIAKSNVTLYGAQARLTTISAGGGLSGALVLGLSGDRVTNFGMRSIGLDGAYSAVGGTLNGIQITNGSFVAIEDCKISNFGGTLVLLQGLNMGGGTSDSIVRDNLLNGGGLADGTTGFGVLVKDSSSRCQVIDNRIDGVVGGMGIGGTGSSGTGYPTNCVVSGNIITQARSTTGFEAIGITAGCVEWNVSNNNIVDSQDNGISVSADRCTVAGNVIDGALNHGIASSGSGTSITGNIIRNVGQIGGADYGGIYLGFASFNVVGFNRIVDDQSTPSMTSGVKLVASAGNNLIGFNQISGQTGLAYEGAAVTDIVFDANSNVGGVSTSKIYADTIGSRTFGRSLLFGTTVQAQSQLIVGSAGGSQGQLVAHTNTVLRPTAALVAVASQTADLLACFSADGSTVVGGITVGGRVYGHDGVTTMDVNTLGLTSAQIDAQFASTPADGTILSDSTNSLLLVRQAGQWCKTTLTRVS